MYRQMSIKFISGKKGNQVAAREFMQMKSQLTQDELHYFTKSYFPNFQKSLSNQLKAQEVKKSIESVDSQLSILNQRELDLERAQKALTESAAGDLSAELHNVKKNTLTK